MSTPTQIAKEVFESARNPSSLIPLSAYEQSRIARWQRQNFGEVPLEQILLGVAEEVGEACHAMLKHRQGIRGLDSDVVFLEAIGDAIADATIFLMQAATALKLDFCSLVSHTVSDVAKRDWKNNSGNVGNPTTNNQTNNQ